MLMRWYKRLSVATMDLYCSLAMVSKKSNVIIKTCPSSYKSFKPIANSLRMRQINSIKSVRKYINVLNLIIDKQPLNDELKTSVTKSISLKSTKAAVTIGIINENIGPIVASVSMGRDLTFRLKNILKHKARKSLSCTFRK